MKYANLIQIAQFLAKFSHFYQIKRINDNAILIKFDDFFELIFDLNKANSAIYQTDEISSFKTYKAPFDFALKKRFLGAKIDEISVQKNNRILVFKTTLNGTYKVLKTTLYFEFTGRFTNAIICDEVGVIIAALKHTQNEKRSIKPGEIYVNLEPFLIKEKPCEKITNFTQFFKNEYKKQLSKQFDEKKSLKISQLQKKLNDINSLLKALENKDDLLKQSEILNQKATLLIANLHKFSGFEREFDLVDFNGKCVKFKLENSPKISANLMFAKAKKLRQKATNIDIQRQNLTQKAQFCENLLSLLNSAQNLEQLDIILPPKNIAFKQNLQKNNANIQNFYIGEYKISVGKNEIANANLLKNASKDDFWFHLKDYPSAHIIVKTNKQKLNDEVILMAAKICVNFSVKQSGNYAVDYTKRQFVKIISGSNVNYINQMTIYVKK